MSENSANSLDIILYDINKAQQIAGKIEKSLGYPFYVYTVFDLHSSVFAWIELQKEPIPLVLGLISIVAVFNIITVLLITVVEKTYSIGILRALGMSRKNIIKIIAGLIQKSYKIVSLEGEMYFLDALPIKFELWHFAIVISTALLLSFFATLIPSFIAAKIQPVKALRFK